MGRDGPTLPLASTEAHDVLDLLPLDPVFPGNGGQDNPLSIQTRSRNRRSHARKEKGVRYQSLSRGYDFPELLLSSDKSQAQQPDPNPYQLSEPPEQRESDTGDVGIAEGLKEEQISAVLGSEATGDEEGAAFDKDGEGGDRDRRESHGRPTQIPDDDIHFQHFRDPT